jgi:hypothetical protein
MKTAIAIVLKKDLPVGLVGNICACLGTGILNINRDIIGQDIVTPDLVYKAITQIPIVVLTENKLGMNEVIRRARHNRLEFVLYDKLAVGATDYIQYGEDIKKTAPDNREILGIAMVGEEEAVKKVTGDLPLLKATTGANLL